MQRRGHHLAEWAELLGDDLPDSIEEDGEQAEESTCRRT